MAGEGSAVHPLRAIPGINGLLVVRCGFVQKKKKERNEEARIERKAANGKASAGQFLITSMIPVAPWGASTMHVVDLLAEGEERRV